MTASSQKQFPCSFCPRKLKTEKRMKKVMEEGAMKNKSSTDTPLNTLQKLRSRQAETATPYLILTGNKNNEASELPGLRK